MRRLVRTEGAERRGARGAAFMWVLLIAFPLMFFGLSMAVDFTRVVIAGRQASTATQAAALSAAYQFVPGEARLDAVAARTAAIETVCVAQDEGALSLSDPGDGRVLCPSVGDSVAVAVRMVNSSTVEVSTSYRVSGLLLLRYFSYGDVDQVSTRTAAICDPTDTSGPTGGYCSRPEN